MQLLLRTPILLGNEVEELELGLRIRVATRVGEEVEPRVVAHLVHGGEPAAEQVLLAREARARAGELQTEL